MNIKEKKKAFASLPIMAAMKAIKCGFELETQRVDGNTYDQCVEDNDDCDREIDYERVGEVISQEVSDILSERAIRYYRRFLFNSNQYFARPFYPLMKAALASNIWHDSMPVGAVSSLNIKSRLYIYLREDNTSLENLITLLDFERDEIIETLEEYIHDSFDYSDYYLEPESNDKFYLDGIPDGIEAKYDSSVSGPEFIVEGNGTSVSNAIKLLKQLFDTFTFKIDMDCSFHVHVSIPGIQHAYGANLQTHMYEYLLKNVKRVPKSVRKRWEENTRYFQPNIQEDKYSFVHFHSRYRTWEFRCFGNVQNVKDGARCIRLAVEALQYAYKVSLGMERANVKTAQDWTPDLYTGVIKYSEDYAGLVKKKRKEKRDMERNAA